MVLKKKRAPKKSIIKKKKNNKVSKKGSSVKSKKFSGKVSSGVKGIDKITGGGFVGNSINMVAGFTGTGKSILVLQFLVEGLKKGEKCLYVSFEEKREEVYANMLKIGFDFEKYEKKGNFFFIEYTPQKVKTMLEEGGGEIETIVISKKIERMGIDSITAFTSLFSDKAQERESILSLFILLRRWNCTTLLTSEMEPNQRDNKSQSVLEFESDSIINLYFVMEKNERKRFIEVLKMRGSNHSKDVFSYSIGKGGISLKGKAHSRNLKIN